jgi:arylsulfatase A
MFEWDDPPYDGKKGYLPQKNPRAAYAAMVSRLDRTVGRISRILHELNLAEATLIVFTSDNGSTYDVGGYDPSFFQGTGSFRANKGSVYEGGIRIPFIARWPGHVRQSSTSDRVFAFQDLLPTLLDVAGTEKQFIPQSDGMSIAPELLGQSGQKQHEYLYMEFPAYGGQQMVRIGNWKGVRQDLMKSPNATVELYNLKGDPAESKNVAAEHLEIVARIKEIMLKSHSPSKEFPFPALDH